MFQVRDVNVMRLSSFVLDVVAKRRLPGHVRGDLSGGNVLMKMDIEGSEVEVRS